MSILQSAGTALADPDLVKQPNPTYWQWPRMTVLAGALRTLNTRTLISQPKQIAYWL
jgi:hypothetical protein